MNFDVPVESLRRVGDVFTKGMFPEDVLVNKVLKLVSVKSFLASTGSSRFSR